MAIRPLLAPFFRGLLGFRADNVTAEAIVSSGSIFKTDEAAGSVHWPYTKIAFGADDTQTIVGSISSNPFPVALSATDNAVLDTINTAVEATQAAVEIMDDWDETNRAAVNLIASQVGVSGGTGTDAATVLRVSLATDIPLPAGTAEIGKLAANSGTDIGDVDVTSVIPLTGATNLGKAIDVAVGASDVGVAMLAKHAAASARLSTATNDYDIPRLSEFGALLTEPEQHLVIDQMDALLGNGGTWAAIDSDTTGVTVSTKHVLGLKAVEFDKVDGAANSGIGGVTKALTALDFSGLSPHDILQTVVYVSSTAALDSGNAFVFLRLGTDSTDYQEWRINADLLTAGIWETIAFEIGDASHTGQGGDGITWTAITYIAVGFVFDAVGDALANILVDEISLHTNQHVNAAINAEITSTINSANININKVRNSTNSVANTGTVGAGTQRVTIATDDAAITSLQLLDNAISGAGFNITQQGGVNVSLNTGVRDTGTQRVTIATNDSVPVTGTFWQATQPVSGTVTANPASGTIDTVTTVSTVTSLSQLAGVAIPVLGTSTYTEATSTGVIAGAVRNDTLAALANTDNEIAPLQVNASGALYSQANIISGGIASGALAAGSIAAGAVVSGAILSGALASGSIAAGAIVDLPNVTLAAGTNTNEVVGDVAHAAAAAGNPVAVGVRATNSMEGLTQVAAAQASYVTSDLNGVIVTRTATTLEELVSYNSGANTAGTELTVTTLDAGGGGIHNYVTAVTVHNSHATTMGFVNLLDGASGTVLWTFPNPATGGTTMRFDPPLKQPTANTALFWDGSAAITSVYVSIAGFQAQG